MEVQLRKTKITASILKQMQHANKDEIMTFKVLGYFIIMVNKKSFRQALLTDGTNYKLCVFVTSFEVHNRQLAIGIGHGTASTYSDLDPSYAKLLGERFMDIKKQALELGQIFY